MECIASLELYLKLYLDELSRMFFKKENMRNKSWQLSVFYSPCIQSIVRKALIELVQHRMRPNEAINIGNFGASGYLHLAVRLFTATSGVDDALMRGFSSDEQNQSAKEDTPSKRDYRIAEFAVEREDWNAWGISNSGEYLRKIFEDDVGNTDSCHHTRR
jgi:hypothetical protein